MRIIVLALIITSCSVPGRELDSAEFDKHYHYLDSIYVNNMYDTSCVKSVIFMEKVTGIKAHPDGNLVGRYYFNRSDLRAWKAWGDEHAVDKKNIEKK